MTGDRIFVFKSYKFLYFAQSIQKIESILKKHIISNPIISIPDEHIVLTTLVYN